MLVGRRERARLGDLCVCGNGLVVVERCCAVVCVDNEGDAVSWTEEKELTSPPLERDLRAFELLQGSAKGNQIQTHPPKDQYDSYALSKNTRSIYAP